MLMRSLIEYIDKETTFKIIKIVGLHLVSVLFILNEKA